MNFIAGRVDAENREVLELETGETMVLPETGFAQRSGQAVTFGIRPNHMHPVEGGNLHLEVNSVEQLGGESYLYGKLRNGQPMTLHLSGQTNAGRGDTLAIAPDHGEIHLFDSNSGLTLRMD